MEVDSGRRGGASPTQSTSLEKALRFQAVFRSVVGVGDFPKALFSLLQNGIHNLYLTDLLATSHKLELVEYLNRWVQAECEVQDPFHWRLGFGSLCHPFPPILPERPASPCP